MAQYFLLQCIFSKFSAWSLVNILSFFGVCLELSYIYFEPIQSVILILDFSRFFLNYMPFSYSRLDFPELQVIFYGI